MWFYPNHVVTTTNDLSGINGLKEGRKGRRKEGRRKEGRSLQPKKMRRTLEKA